MTREVALVCWAEFARFADDDVDILVFQGVCGHVDGLLGVGSAVCAGCQSTRRRRRLRRSYVGSGGRNLRVPGKAH